MAAAVNSPCGFQHPTGDRICTISGIRGHIELAVKCQVVPFSHFSLQTQEFELSLGMRASISCRCEHALCFFAVPAPLPMPGFQSETCLNLSSVPLLAWFYTRKPSQTLLATGRVMGPSASGVGRPVPSLGIRVGSSAVPCRLHNYEVKCPLQFGNP